ncbi:MAG TPA: histidine kinase [Flavilitoribacter sp.]|nr:histidine kinase [Flavilitoribacter sp.]HMQ91291.1 histidine kinase [Flavilitoribacter sp.]
MALLIVLMIVEGVQQGFFFTFTNELINIFFFSLLVYFNLYYLVPNYLTQNKFMTYGLLLVLSAILITPLKMMVFYLKFSNFPKLQATLIKDINSQFLINFLFASVSTIVKIITDWARQMREKQELVTQTMQSELRFLKSQINPHFLFNTLNNLYALTLKKSDQAPDIVIKLSEMMRYMLYECNEKRVPLSKEVNYIQNYLELEKLRQSNRDIEITFEVNGTIKNQQIAPLMFIPFLENSFKHGLSHQISHGFVHVRLDVDDNCVQFYIENSKPDTAPVRDNRPSGGIGLVNIHRRLNLLYPNQYELKIEDNPNAYAVNLFLELDD